MSDFFCIVTVAAVADVGLDGDCWKEGLSEDSVIPSFILSILFGSFIEMKNDTILKGHQQIAFVFKSLIYSKGE